MPSPSHESSPVLLSVLVPSVDLRATSSAPRLLNQLFSQRAALSPEDQQKIEVIVLADTRSRSVGRKRNDLVAIAQGEYVAFVDDDDRVADDYLAQLLGAIQREYADVVTFEVAVTVNGSPAKTARYSIGYQADQDAPNEYRRLPNHLCAVRRSLVLQTGFADRTWGEDSDYSKRLKPRLETQTQIGKVLYYYDYDESSSLTEPYRPGSSRELPALLAPPASELPAVTTTDPTVLLEGETVQPAAHVDLVILSKASTERLRQMTLSTIRTALKGAAPHSARVIVVEQNPKIIYPGTLTIHDTGEFAYNRLANKGIRHGSSQWVVVANNDLVFQSNWLAPLLQAGHPLMSPRDPVNAGQRLQGGTEIGNRNGRHLSGWCYMIKRELWQQMRGLDEDFVWWCADDVVIEQAGLLGVKPMLVAASQVRHLGSQTGKIAEQENMDGDGSRTWAMVDLLARKYGRQKFIGVPGYEAWRRQQQQQSSPSASSPASQAQTSLPSAAADNSHSRVLFPMIMSNDPLRQFAELGLKVGIPWREHKSRTMAFEETVNWYQQNGFTVVTMDAQPSTPQFNPAAARNALVREHFENAPVAILSDADTVPEIGPLLEAIKSVVVEGSNLVQLPYNLYRHEKGPGDGFGHEFYENACSGVLVFKPATWWEIGGQDERFMGWGFEDTAFRLAHETLLGPMMRHQGTVHAAWHEPARRESLNQNRRLYLKYSEAYGNPSLMRQVIQRQAPIVMSTAVHPAPEQQRIKSSVMPLGYAGAGASRS